MAQLSPDKILADLQAKLAKATTDADIANIQEQIDQRQAEITTESGGAAFGSAGMYIPANAATGTTILQPTYEQGVYTKTTLTGDTTVDQYGRSNLGNAVTLYDASGKPLTAADAAKTETGLNFAAAGRDIGFGAGLIAPGVKPDIEFATFNSGRAASPDAAASAGLVGSGNVINTDTTTTRITATPDGISTLTAAEQASRNNAIASLTATFNAMGLGGDIASAITDMIQKGYTTDTIMMIAQDPTSKDPVALAFQKRFPANADRIKAGLPPLSPADYMLNEKAYRAAMQQAGLPKGFYDSQQDFTKFIANDVSPSELQSRINTAADAIANADPFYTSSLKAMYGLTTGDMIAHALDPQAALPLLQKQAEALKIGTAAARQGWGISATGAENLYTQGVTAAQAAQGFKTVAGMQTDQQRLAEIWGGDTAAQGQNLVAATFGTAGAAYADQQIKALQQKEINAFSGASGVAKGSLGVSTEQTGGNL